MSVKDKIKKIVPYHWVESARRLFYMGGRYHCSVCGAHVRSLKAQGYGYPVLEELQVVGGMYKDNDVCPVCRAGDRDRLVVFYFERHLEKSALERRKLLHIAPEKGLSKAFARLPSVEYIPGDIEPQRYWHLDNIPRVDLTAMPFEDGSIHLLVCNHVLEHIVDDVAAMREIKRVLADDGIAILQTPISLKLPETVEGDGSESEDEKIRRFGQKDHVRIYTAPDYIRRLETAGLSVECYSAFEDDAGAAAALRLNPFEVLFLCRPARKADATSGTAA